MPEHEHNFRTQEYNPVSILYDSGPNSWYGVLSPGTQTMSAKELHLTRVGGGQGHKHTNPNTNSTKVIPPYYAVYIWKRVS